MHKNVKSRKKCYFFFVHFIFQNFLKCCLWRSAPSLCKWNTIINFVLSVKLYEKKDFLQDSQKAYIFCANCFLYVLQKKSRNKHNVGPHDTYVLFSTFFSQVTNKRFFFSPGEWIMSISNFWLLLQASYSRSVRDAIC